MKFDKESLKQFKEGATGMSEEERRKEKEQREALFKKVKSWFKSDKENGKPKS